MKNGTAILLMIMCSLLGTAAQMLFKISADNMSGGGISSYLNPMLLGAFVFYGLSFLLLTIALSKGELSVLYPFIGLTYVWVTLLSPIVFNTDRYDPVRLAGVAVIIAGISMIGIGGSKKNNKESTNEN